MLLTIGQLLLISQQSLWLLGQSLLTMKCFKPTKETITSLDLIPAHMLCCIMEHHIKMPLHGWHHSFGSANTIYSAIIPGSIPTIDCMGFLPGIKCYKSNGKLLNWNQVRKKVVPDQEESWTTGRKWYCVKRKVV